MRLFFCFVLLSCYSDSGLAIDLIQDKLTVIKGPRKTARIACRLSGSATYVHWYRQKDSEAPDRVLYIPTSGGNPVRDDPTLRQKFNAEKNTDEYTLIIDNTQVEDSATYYCAAWEYHTARGAPAARSKTHVLGWGGGGGGGFGFRLAWSVITGAQLRRPAVCDVCVSAVTSDGFGRRCASLLVACVF